MIAGPLKTMLKYLFPLYLPFCCIGQTQVFDCVAEYKKGIVFYNKGIEVLSDTTKGEQHRSNKMKLYFREALPFLTKADSLCPNDINNVQALMGIHYAFSDDKKYAIYRIRLEGLKKKQKNGK